LTRQLTKHVVTRWYRAPELILIQPYTSAVDIWSLGCILAELLSMQEGSVPGYQDRSPLFPGGTCYPLSGEGGNLNSDERLDQLSVIFGVIGTPSPEDIAAIGKANEYIKTLGKIQSKALESLYPAADPAALDLLKQMLKFNPRSRCTAEEALEHDFFRNMRRPEMEGTAETPLLGPDFLDAMEIDLDTLKRRTYEEVLWYRNQEAGATPTAATNN
jgi:mitogen-activated protein kinase 1/3